MTTPRTLLHTSWLIAFCLSCVVANAQTAPDTYWVQFTDKDATPYSLSQPEQFLSQRAMDRRAAQGIAYDALDLPVDPAYIETVLAAGEVDLLNRSKWFNAITIRTTDQNALAAIQGLPFIQAIRSTGSNMATRPTRDKFQALAGVPDRDGEPESYGQSFLQIAMLNGHQLHALGAQGQGMLIGVLDSGFDGVDSSLAFQHVRDRDGFRLTRDFVTHDGDVYADHWHGRSVLSCMAGRLDGQLLGTAPEADYVLLRTEDVFSEYPVEEDNWISGAELADSLGCDVLNTSLGYTTFDDSTMDHSYADLDGQTLRMSIAANIASRKGMIPVQSAGNSGASDWYYISAPADAIDILSVGAVGDVENHAWFSSHGPSADGRVKPDVCAMGWGAVVLRSDTDSVTHANGTSFSSPILAGLVACLWQLHPQRNASEIMAAVRQSASFFTAPNDSLGYGVPDFAAAHAWLEMMTAVPEEVVRPDFIRAFPVPFQNTFSTELSAADGPAFVALFDVQGRVVFATRSVVSNGLLQLTDTRLAALPDGGYLLKVQQGDQLWNVRTAKQP